MLALAHYLFGVVGSAVMIMPVIFAISSGAWQWLIALIPAFFLSRPFYALSGYFKAKIIQKHTGMDIQAQSDNWHQTGRPW